MISIPLNAPVECTDGPIGESSAVIVDRDSLRVTHFVVKERHSPHADRLVPIDQVAESTHDLIKLSCTKAELGEMGAFSANHYRAVEIPRYQDSSMIGDSYYVPGEAVISVEQDHVPAGAKDLSAGADVHATDGKVGQVDELLIDAETGQITHFVMREGHPWARKDVIMPVSVVEYADGNVVYLKIDKETISSLLAIPESQYRDAASVELFTLTLKDMAEANKALEALKPLTKKDVRAVLDAAVLVKDEDGKTSMKELEDVDRRHGALFGAITGGLIGLVGGPAGVVVGAVAGAATGGVAAGWIDMGFPDEYLKTLQQSMQPSSALVVVLVDVTQADRVIETLADFGGDVLRQALTDEMVTELSAGK